MNDMPVVVVTGGAGYIGSHTITCLLGAGYSVVSIDNLCRSPSDVFDGLFAITGTSVKNYCVDLCDRSAVSGAFSEIGEIAGVIHFAAYKSVPESVKDPISYFRNNLFSLNNVLECCVAHSVRRVVFSSSCSVYGDVGDGPVSESTPLREPKSPYARTKVIGENMLKDVCGAFDIRGLCLRYFNPVGAHPSALIGESPMGSPDNLVPVITETAIGKRQCMTVFGGNLPTRDGSCIRDYVHVCDIARAHQLSLEFLTETGKSFDIINLGTGHGVSVFEAISAFELVSGEKLAYVVGDPRPGDVVEIRSDAKKARQLLGWLPEYSLDSMLRTAWAWEVKRSAVQMA